jgi:hypothetical protein
MADYYRIKTRVPELEGHRDVTFAWFGEWKLGERGDDYSLFSEDEANLLVGWLKAHHDGEHVMEKVTLPDADRMRDGILYIDGWNVCLHSHPDWDLPDIDPLGDIPLPFKVFGCGYSHDLRHLEHNQDDCEWLVKMGFRIKDPVAVQDAFWKTTFYDRLLDVGKGDRCGETAA